MRTRAQWKFVAKATALGARVPQAELFIHSKPLGGETWQSYHRKAPQSMRHWKNSGETGSYLLTFRDINTAGGAVRQY